MTDDIDPTAPAVGLPGRTRGQLAEAGRAHRALVGCFLVQAGCSGAWWCSDPEGVARLAFGLGALIAWVLCVSLVFLVSRVLWNTRTAAVLTLVAAIPLIGFVALLVVDVRARRCLRENGMAAGIATEDSSSQAPPEC